MGSTARNSACPVCGAPVGPRPENAAFPFCTERCRTIDLGHWLDERYRIPSAESPADDPDDAD
jgi:uncharacterized protein